MIIYNVTIQVDWSIHEEWLSWMKEEKIPGMLATGLFVEYHLVRLLQVDETDGPTYAVQYYTSSLDRYDTYLEQHSGFQSKMEIDKWGNFFVSFSTIMEVVQ